MGKKQSYRLEKHEKILRKEAANRAYTGLQGLGMTSGEEQARANSIKDAFQSEATTRFQNQLNPIMQGIRNDTAKRFGSLNNSFLTDRLYSLQKDTINPTLQSIAQNATLMQEDIMTQQQNRKVQALGAANDALNSISGRTSSRLSTINAQQQTMNQQSQNGFGRQLASGALNLGTAYATGGMSLGLNGGKIF